MQSPEGHRSRTSQVLARHVDRACGDLSGPYSTARDHAHGRETAAVRSLLVGGNRDVQYEPLALSAHSVATRTKSIAIIFDQCLSVFLATSLMRLQLWTLAMLGPKDGCWCRTAALKNVSGAARTLNSQTGHIAVI